MEKKEEIDKESITGLKYRRDIQEILPLLTDVEQAVLKVLYFERRALSVKEIRNLLVQDLIKCIKQSTTISNYFHDSVLKTIDKRTLEKAKSELNEIPEKPQSKYLQLAEKIIKKYKIAEIPSYQTIEKILNGLVEAKLVIKRKPLMATKTKFVYAIEPTLLKNA